MNGDTADAQQSAVNAAAINAYNVDIPQQAHSTMQATSITSAQVILEGDMIRIPVITGKDAEELARKESLHDAEVARELERLQHEMVDVLAKITTSEQGLADMQNAGGWIPDVNTEYRSILQNQLSRAQRRRQEILDRIFVLTGEPSWREQINQNGTDSPDLNPAVEFLYGFVVTGGKAVVNGTAQATVNTVTLGFGPDDIILISPDEFDRGYDTSVVIVTGTAETLIGLGTGTGGASLIAKGGKVAKVGKAIIAFDVTGGVIATGDAAVDSYNDPSALNLTRLALGAAGTVAPLAPSISRQSGNAVDALDELPVAPNSAVHVAGQGSTIRKVNLRPGTDPKWGLTKKHLNKHFFGNSKFALKKIDPGGTADKWKQHLAELYNGPVSGTTSNGMLDVVKTFPRADGSGTFKMGIRLFDRGDGTFDLVTVLTKQ